MEQRRAACLQARGLTLEVWTTAQTVGPGEVWTTVCSQPLSEQTAHLELSVVLKLLASLTSSSIRSNVELELDNTITVNGSV